MDPMSGHMGVKACHVDPMSGRMGVKQTLNRISERFIWPGMVKDRGITGLQ